MALEHALCQDNGKRPQYNVKLQFHILVNKSGQKSDICEVLVVGTVVLIEEGTDSGHGLQVASGAHEAISQGEEKRI